jgi:hypothetical protein
VNKRAGSGACGTHRARIREVTGAAFHVDPTEDLGATVGQFKNTRPNTAGVQLLRNVVAQKTGGSCEKDGVHHVPRITPG